MTDRPIIFSTPMAAALWEGRKTQTRLVLNPQPPQDLPYVGVYAPKLTAVFGSDCVDEEDIKIPLRYMPGDLLWVREPWQALSAYDKTAPRDIPFGSDILYTAERPDFPWLARKRPAMFMPRWAARQTLVVTQVRAQRVQDITEQDAIAEGSEPYMAGHGVATREEALALRAEGFPYPEDYKAGFQILWNSIHGHNAWDANPWVVALTFTHHRANINDLP